MVEVGRVEECFLFVLLCLCRLWCLGLCLKIFIKVFLSLFLFFDLWMFRFFLFLEFFIVKLFDFEFLELFKLLVWELLVLILFEFFWFFSMWLFFFYIKCFMFLFLEKVGESWVLEFWKMFLWLIGMGEEFVELKGDICFYILMDIGLEYFCRSFISFVGVKFFIDLLLI